MTTFIDALDRIPNPKRTDAELIDLIDLARLGDRDAKLTLLRTYLAPILKEVTRVTRGAIGAGLLDAQDFRSGQEDVFSEAVLVFYRVVDAFDTDRGMRGFVTFLTRALQNDEDVNASLSRARAFRIPYVTLRRRTQAMREAGNDLAKARELAPKYSLSKGTFDTITDVFNSDGLFDDVGFGESEAGYVRIDDLHDTARALEALDFTSRIIVESSFGLNGQPQQSNSEIGESLGLTRWAVQRRLNAAMLVMKEALNDKETQ